jgi:CubicO group peptidase (beta-lactamase class C family)
MRHFSLAFVISLLSFASFAQHQKAEREFETLINELQVVGLSVVAVKNNEIVYQHNFGMQDVGKQIPLNNKSIFRIASISKSFSATTIMQLIEAKKLRLDDDFSKLVGFKIRNPNFPNTVITLKMIMSHTSSISDRNGYFNLDVINPDKNPEWAKCYNTYAPGTQYEYCNLNYNMIGAVIERHTNERFDMRIRYHILDPLGLYGGYNVDSLDASRFATLYNYDSASQQFMASPQAYASRSEQISNYTMGYSTPIFSPTGGMKIGAVDLAKYMMMHMNDGMYKGIKIMSKKSARQLRVKISEEEGYGMAMRQATDLVPGKLLNGHTGSAYGLYSAMFFHPKEKFGFVVITNGCLPDQESDIRAVLRRSITILYNNFVKE